MPLTSPPACLPVFLPDLLSVRPGLGMNGSFSQQRVGSRADLGNSVSSCHCHVRQQQETGAILKTPTLGHKPLSHSSAFKTSGERFPSRPRGQDLRQDLCADGRAVRVSGTWVPHASCHCASHVLSARRLFSLLTETPSYSQWVRP